MNFEEIMKIIGKWGGTLKFFPSDPDARIGIAEEIAEMCHDADQVRWLVKRVPQLHDEWPGAREIRAVLCSKFRPKDGVEAYSELKRFENGIPSEKAAAPPALAGREALRIASGEPASTAPSIAATVADLATAKDLNRAVRQIDRVRDIPERQVPAGERITAADVEREVQRLRDLRAREELSA